MPAKGTKVPAKKPPTPAVPRDQIGKKATGLKKTAAKKNPLIWPVVEAKVTPTKGKGAVKAKPVKPAKAKPFPGPASPHRVSLNSPAWPFPPEPKPPVPVPATFPADVAAKASAASFHTGGLVQNAATPERIHMLHHHHNVSWTLNVNARPQEGWYYCLCRNGGEGTIGFMVMYYDAFRGVFRRPEGDDGPDELQIIAFTAIPNGHFVSKMLDDFDHFMEGGK